MPHGTLSIEDLLRLPPMILGTIRWKKKLGRPAGDLCSGFDFLLEEKTATQYRDAGGGVIEPIPGTGKWRVLSNSVLCRSAADEGDEHVLRFQFNNLQFNQLLDGAYHVTPSLKGPWEPAGILQILIGYRLIEPLSELAQIFQNRPGNFQENDGV